MRVIAGTFRSRILKAPAGTGTRPTSDRLRETLFNVLAPRLTGAVFADLYAGSGAVGIEAVSRGATQVFFAETAAPALRSLRANLQALGIRSGINVETAGVANLLRRLVQAPTLLDLVFLDPPYEAAAEYESTLRALGTQAADLLSPDAIVVAEHARKCALEDRYSALQRSRLLTQGDAALSFFRVTTQKSAQE